MSRSRKTKPEPTEFAEFTRRILRAYGRRTDLDPADLAELVGLQREFDQAVRVIVRAMRVTGFSWAEIGNGLGTTKQAAYERFGTRTAAP